MTATVRRPASSSAGQRGALAGAALAGLALVAGCTVQDSADGTARSHEASATAEATFAAEPGTPPLAQNWTALGEDTPLGEYRGYMHGPTYDFDRHVQALVEANEKRQQSVATCMKSAGFDYRPVPYAGPREQTPHPGYIRSTYLMVPPLDPDRAVVAEWGYGLDPEEWPDILTPPGADPESAETAAENDAYRKALPAAQQDAYGAALFGPADSEGRPLDPGAGCMGAAYAETPEVGAAPPLNKSFVAAHEGLIFDLIDLTTWDVGLDPRSVALDKEWEACAVQKGLDFSGQVYEIRGRPASDASMLNRPSPGGAISMARFYDETGERLDPRELDGGDDLYLRAYPAQVEIALIDFDCREQVDYMARVMAIRVDVEQQFLDANRDRLAAMKADATREG